MIQANSILNENLHGNGLPSISYRISANYGLVELATSTNSNGVDLFGPTVNICSKINHLSFTKSNGNSQRSIRCYKRIRIFQRI